MQNPERVYETLDPLTPFWLFSKAAFQPALRNASDAAIDLVREMLRVNPTDRTSVLDALKHPFFRRPCGLAYQSAGFSIERKPVCYGKVS